MALIIPKSFSGTPASLKSQVESLLAKATTPAEVNAITTAARTSNAKFDNAVLVAANNRIATAKPATPATPAKPATPATSAKPATPANLFKPPDPNTTIKNIMSGKGGSDTITDSATGNKYNLVPQTATTATWYVSRPGASTADPVNASTGEILSTGGTTLAALTKNRQAWYQANPTETAKQSSAAIEAKAKADAAAAAEAKAAQERAAAEQAVKEQNAAKVTQLRNDFVNNVINKGTATKQQIDDYKNTVTELGGTPDDNLIKRAQVFVNNSFDVELGKAKTLDQLTEITNRAKEQGATINQG
jgi:hypothetical protein